MGTGEMGHALIAPCEMSEEAAAGGIRQRGKSSIQRC